MFVTDKEARERLNLPPKVWRRLSRELDKRKPGRRPFPRPVALAGNRRWWPDVEAYFADPATIAQLSENDNETRKTRTPRRPGVPRSEGAAAAR